MKSCHAIECFCTDFNRRFCKHFTNPKKPPKFLQKTGAKRRKISELDFFQSEWKKRGGYCFITGEKLIFHPGVCFHVLGKGAFPSYRLNPENLIFVNAKYHNEWHVNGQQKCLEKDPRWQMVIDLYNKLKIQYNSKLPTHAKRWDGL